VRLKQQYEFRKQRRLISALVCAVALLLTQLADASEHSPSEHDIKAAFLVSVLKFVHWPADKRSPNDIFTIGIVGQDPFGDAFIQVEGRSIQGRKLVINRYGQYQEDSDFSTDHLLFVSDSERENLGKILSTLTSSGVLTVSDISDFTAHNGMIYLFFENDRLGFDIHHQVMDEDGLKIHSALLGHARNVIRKPGKNTEIVDSNDNGTR